MLSQKRKQLVSEINDLLEIFNNPLPEKEIDSGWNIDNQIMMINLLVDVRQKIENKQALPAHFNIIKIMDYWGVFKGDIVDKAAELDCNLRENYNGII